MTGLRSTTAVVTTFLLGMALLSGCNQPEETSVGRISPAMQRALSVDVRPFNEAFARTSSEPHTADRVDVVQRAGIDDPLTSRTRLIFDGEVYVDAEADVSGSLPSCRICELLGRSTPHDAAAVERFFVDDDAPFLNATSASAFEYVQGADTLVDGRTLETIHIRAIEDDPRTGRYRSATLFIDALDETLIGIDIDTRRETFFIREGGRRTAFIDRLGDSAFPRSATIVQRVRVLTGGERVIHTEIHYSSDAGARSPS